ncbi:MAG: alpha/beta hydrolase [Pseudomonadota bacterium]
MAYTHVNGLRLYYEEFANPGKPVLLMVHGAGQDTVSWRFNVEPLAPHFHLVLLDLPGHGKSAAPPRGFIDDYADTVPYVAGFMEALGIPRYVVLGHSFASGLGLHLALAHPDRVQALFMIDGTGCPSGAWGGKAFDIVSVNMVDWLEVNFRLICGHSTPRERVEEIASDVRRCCSPEVAVGDIASFAKTDLRARLHELRLPVVDLHGEEDWSIPPALGMDTVALIGANARFRLIPGAGHFPHTEQPEQFNAAFLQEWERVAAELRQTTGEAA